LGKKKGGAVTREESPEDMARFQKRFAMHKAIGGKVKKMAGGGRVSIFDAPVKRMAEGGGSNYHPDVQEALKAGRITPNQAKWMNNYQNTPGNPEIGTAGIRDGISEKMMNYRNAVRAGEYTRPHFMEPIPKEVKMPYWATGKLDLDREGLRQLDKIPGLTKKAFRASEYSNTFPAGTNDVNYYNELLKASKEAPDYQPYVEEMNKLKERNPDIGKASGGRASIFDKPVHMVDGGKVAKGLMGAIEKASTAADAAMAKPTVDRLSMSYKDVTKRVPEVADAVDKLLKGEITKAQYNDIVNTYKPVTPYSFVPKPATKEEAVGALRGDAAKERYGKQAEYTPGSKIGLRLDIPAYTGKGVWVNSIHDEKAKKVAYGPVASVKNADLGISQNESKRIALGGAKAPYARIKGDWNPITEEEAIAKSQEYLNHPEWRQIGMDPERHSYFYDRRTMQPITGAEEIIQIGPLVLGKNPKYGSIDDFDYADGGKVVSKLANAFKKASNAADAAMAEKRVFKTSDGYTFRETPTGEVTNGDMSWPNAKEFMKDMPHAYQAGDDLGKRKAMIEGYGRPDPENIVNETSKFMPDDAYAQFLRAYNKQNAPVPKPNLTVVKARGGLAMADGGNVLRGNILAGASWNSLNKTLGNELTTLTGQPTTNTSVGGATTADTYKQLMDFINGGGSFDPNATVFLQTGGVDFITGVPREEVKNNIEQIISVLDQQGVNVVLTGAPYAASMDDVINNNFDPRIDPLFEEIAAAHPNVALVDSMGDILQDKSLLSDAIHTNETGTRRYNDDVMGALTTLQQRESQGQEGREAATSGPQEVEAQRPINIPNLAEIAEDKTENDSDVAEAIAQLGNNQQDFEIAEAGDNMDDYQPPQQVSSVPDYSRAYEALGGADVVNGLRDQLLGMGIDESIIADSFSKYYPQEYEQEFAQEMFKQGGAVGQESPADMARFHKRFAMHKAIGGNVKKMANGGRASIFDAPAKRFDGGGVAAADVGKGTEDKNPTKAGLMAEYLAQMAKDQAKEEYESYKKPRAATDIANRGILAPAVGAPVDLINMGLAGIDFIGSKVTGKPIRLSSEKPFGGSEHLKDLMDKYGVTSGEDRPMTETALSLFSPTGMIKGAMGMTKGAVKAADAMRKPMSGAMRAKAN
jgi:hypothetical protein